MTGNIYFPEEFVPEELDFLLSKGWYRMGQLFFTTTQIPYDNGMYPVRWLRYHTASVSMNKHHQRLLNANKSFSVSLHRLLITEEIEELYARYRLSINFDAPPSVYQFLIGDMLLDSFASLLFEVRDHGRLIAAGIFDRGNESIAGIMNFFDPAYKKYSLGKFLMLLKLNYCRENNLAWYYPGYIVKGLPKFDYKLFIDPVKAEIYLNETDEWVMYDPAL